MNLGDNDSMQRGFSLAELLLALVILGQIAVFTIPKVLMAQQNSQREAIFKEAYSTVNQIIYLGVLQGEITADNFSDYILERANSVKSCGSDVTPDCRTQGVDSDPWMANQPGFVMHSGAIVMMEAGSGDDYIVVYIDFNNDGPPNLWGQDQVELFTSVQGDFGTPGKLYCAGGASICDEMLFTQ